MKISSLFLMLMLILSSACGKDGPSRAGKKYTKITPDQIDTIMKNQVMKCGSISGSCPQGMVRLLTLNPEAFEKSSVCSGFMVGATTVVTNHHCIESQAECNNTHVAIYKGSTWNYQRSTCKTVTKTEQDYENAGDPRRKIDYTVFEIDGNYTGTIFALSENRAEVGEAVKAWVIDHTGLDDLDGPNLFESRITEFGCEVKTTSDSASLQLKKCPVIHGNSGSPALNSAGKIIGVIWGATNPDVSSQLDLVTRRSGPGEAAVTEMIHFADWI